MPGVINNLYPPIFKKSYAPAFILTEGCTIYFTLSVYNSSEEIENNLVQVVVQNQRTNHTSLNRELYPSGVKITTMKSEGNGEYSIQISNNDIQDNFQLNQFYKVQIRFTSTNLKQTPNLETKQSIDDWLNRNLQYFSQWSTVLLIKPISNLSVSSRALSLDQDTTSIVTTNNVIISGTVKQLDQNDYEGYKSYRIYIYDNNGFLLEDSGDQYFKNACEIQYNCKYDFQSGESYSLILQILTENLYLKQIIKKFQVNYIPYSSFNAVITATMDNQKGCAVITLKNQIMTVLGTNIVIRRTSSKENFKYWEDVYTTLIQPNTFLDLIWEDYTVESGVWYKYSVVKRNKQNYRSLPIEIRNPIMGDFEDIFLTTKDNQLKLRFDPQISSYSRVVSESLTETIGSKYPFIRRNGRINYRTFTISGTISYLMDIKNNLMHSSQDDLYGDYSYLYKNYNIDNNINYYNDFIQQKNFRQKVLDFLYENNVKLYKSATQGNILVKLMNITLTPNNSLSRKIYTFNCTAYEIDEFNYDNCIKYNIQEEGQYIEENKILIEKYGQVIIPAQDKYWENGEVIETNKNIYFGKKDILTEYIKPKYQGLESDTIDIKVNHISYLKIAFTSDPYPIKISNKVPQPAKTSEDMGSIVCIGHIVQINGNLIIIGKEGIYELTDTDTNITSLKFISEKEQGVIDFEVKIEEFEKEEKQTVIEYSAFSRIGQLWGSFNIEKSLSNSIYNDIMKKYSFTNEESNYKQQMQNIYGLRVYAQPGTIVYVKENQDKDYQKHVLNETGLLQFYDEETNIVGIYFGGSKIYFTEVDEKEKGLRNDEFYDTKEVATLDMIKNPRNNYVYHVPPFDKFKKTLTVLSSEIKSSQQNLQKLVWETDGEKVKQIENQQAIGLQYSSFDKYIFHNGTWYLFSDDNSIQLKRINAIIDYQCSILGERYVE